MTRRRVVLDASAFDTYDTAKAKALRSLLRQTAASGGEVCCAAVTLAEVSRGKARKQRVRAALAQRHGGKRIKVVHTDESFAECVGSILHLSDSGSERLGDAHVVAACSGAEIALVLTSDSEDIIELACAIPGTRVLTRDPATL